MIITKEYDSIDDMMLQESNSQNDYEYAKEAHDLLMDALDLSEKQKIILRSSYSYMEKLLEQKLIVADQRKPKLVRFGKNVYRYDETVYSSEERKIKGKDIIECLHSFIRIKKEEYHVTEIKNFVFSAYKNPEVHTSGLVNDGSFFRMHCSDTGHLYEFLFKDYTSLWYL